MRELGIETLVFAKSDLKSAFHILGILPGHRCFLVMMAKHPLTGKTYFFVDKCLRFGATISCSHFQRFSNALKEIVEGVANQTMLTFITNYLDDFLFVYYTICGCNKMV